MKFVDASRRLLMTVDYKVVNVGETHCVEERSTGYIIKSFDDVSDAKKMMKFLNLGGGFAGFTPEFIVRKLQPALNKNSKNM